MFPVLFVCVLVLAGACKKVCYQCNQYCAYCVAKSDSSVSYVTCANKTTSEIRVDSILYNYQDSGFVCNLLKNQTEVCDGKNSIKDGITYYQKENYFCTPQ